MGRRRFRVLFVACLVLLAAPLMALPSGALEGDVGVRGQSYSGAYLDPSGSKPQSKLWFHDGTWWGVLFDVPSRSFRIHRLDRATQTWSSTGVLVDTRVNSRTDTLFDGTHLYIASHRYSKTSGSGYPAWLHRFAYDATARSWVASAGFPTQINNIKTETLVIDKDSTGRLWAVWTAGSRIWVNRTVGGDATWGTPFLLPNAASVQSDDIASVVAFGSSVGVLWGNQIEERYLFSVHNDADADNAWSTPEVVLGGTNMADDHLSVKAASDGRLFAVLKTGRTGDSDPLVVLAVRSVTGQWTWSTVATERYSHTRPIVVLDEERAQVRVLATGPHTAGGSGQKGGDIFEKVAPMDAPVFADGYGTLVMRAADAADLNNVTASKHPVTAASGHVALATTETLDRYWHADTALGDPPPPPPPSAPTASFTASKTSGEAPLQVSFTDTSDGTPTSWSWTFGQGTGSTEQNPTVTFSNVGTYTVTLTATNAYGSSSTSTTITVTEPPPPPPPSSSVTVTAVDDSYVTSSSPSSTAGLGAYLKVSTSTSSTVRSYIKFTVAGLSAPVASAKVRLYATSSSSDGGYLTTAASTWSESTLSWSNAPAPAAGSLGSVGSTLSGRWFEVDVTPAVSGDGTYTFVLGGGASTAAWFNSRQGTNPPQLVLTTG